ncbi:MAG: hypothetical protein LBB34_03555 [Holosporales bacterium]|nr:hypothetical protein [Holosporales bacterium]
MTNKFETSFFEQRLKHIKKNERRYTDDENDRGETVKFYISLFKGTGC